MGKIISLTGSAIRDALSGVTRQYLVGNLKVPQALPHIPSEMIEIGITKYSQHGVTEAAHKHKQAFEFQYVVSGVTSYRDIDSGQEWIFEAGDFYVIEPGTAYAQKSAADTTILFIKVPPGNDKVPVDASPDVEEWFRKEIGGQ